MSKYTTGELAKLCGVSVRTVQYYDSRGILIPSELTEGGRRIYSEHDLKRMKVICFLRDLDLPINSIKDLMNEEHPENIIALLLEEQEKTLRMEITDRQSRLGRLADLKRSLKTAEPFSVESIGDIAHIMENKKKLRKVRTVMLTIGILMDLVEIATLILWIATGIWLPFVLGMCCVLAMGIGITRFYYRSVSYICPQCHAVFKPNLKQFIFSKHTVNTRKLTCTACGHKGFCAETCGAAPQNASGKKEAE